MTTARAVRIIQPGDVDVLEIVEFMPPTPGRGEVLVEVVAAGLNRADLLQRMGHYPAPAGSPSDIPGLEYSGRVAALGEDTTGFEPGDEVMGIVGGGAMATHLVVHHRELLRVPSGLDLIEAAAVPEAFMTCFDAYLQAGLRAGDKVLVHAVGSGIGTAAVQLARAVGATVLGTSRTAQKIEQARELGLQHGLEVHRESFARWVGEKTKGEGVDIVLDTVGAAYLEHNLRSLAPRGRLVVVGLLGGAVAEIPLNVLLVKRLRILATVLRSRPLEEKATLAQAFSREVLPLFAAKRLVPVVGEVVPMEKIRHAHKQMERNETWGKIVLTWS